MDNSKQYLELLAIQRKIFNMKKLIIYTILGLSLLFFPIEKSFGAITPTADDKALQQIDDLKNKIASRVAQLKLVEKRGILGTVTDSSDTQITLTDSNNNTRYVDVDELTKFSSPSSTSYGISDVKKGSTLGVIGLYNKQSRRILARTIDEVTFSNFFYGIATSLDPKNFSFNLVTENDKVVVDVENITKTLSYSKDSDSLTASGFSKMKNLDNAYVVGFWDKQNKDHLLASKIILFPDFPNNPKITLAPEALKNDAAIIPSTGSGKKLTPIVK